MTTTIKAEKKAEYRLRKEEKKRKVNIRIQARAKEKREATTVIQR